MAVELYEGAVNFFWNEKFWLPPNTTWADLERDDTIFIPQPADLWFSLIMAICLFIVRLGWERYIATPVGRIYHLRERPATHPVQNDVLEEAFRTYRKVLPNDKQVVQKLADTVGFSCRQVERWWRRRRVLGKPSEMQRFRETSWRFLFYLGAFYYGLYVLWDTPWFADTKHCWYGYPKQHVSDGIYWYYMVELGFYFSLILSLFMDEKRKDFLEMMVHHVATISLMVFSWGNNMVRIGTLVLCIHDAVDYWLEGAKLAKYLGYHKLCDNMFLIFTLLWFITRLVIFPYKVLYYTLFEGHLILGMFGAYYAYNCLLCTLQVLHVIWFHMISQVLIKYMLRGQVGNLTKTQMRIIYFILFEGHRIRGIFGAYFIYAFFLCTLQVLHVIWFFMIGRTLIVYIYQGQVEKDERSETEPETESEDECITEKSTNQKNGYIRAPEQAASGDHVANNNTKKME